uniref:Uncharacterized protein n=1 Tax=viral metagenome TaxID=1070528 RepID=A0A6M3L5Q1_9ZZZZ
MLCRNSLLYGCPYFNEDVEMSIFICNECGKYVDSDFHHCYEDPTDGTELLCEQCYFNLYDEDGELPRIF